MTDLAHLRSLALSDLAAEAALNRELRRRDLPPEWSVHPSASPGACADAPPVRVVVAPLLPPTHPLHARLSAVPGVEVDVIVEDRLAMRVHVVLRRAPDDPVPVWRAIADALPVGVLAEGSIRGVVDYEGGHSVRVGFSMSLA